MDFNDNMLFKLADKGDIAEGKSLVVKGPEQQEIALFKIDGEIYALDNLCPHQGGPLGEGDIDHACITCPWHGWEFNIKTGTCINMPGDDAKKLNIKVEGEEIFLVT